MLHGFAGQVDVREYYEKNGELLPSKKGISLDTTQWDKLVAAVPEINAALQQQSGQGSAGASQPKTRPGTTCHTMTCTSDKLATCYAVTCTSDKLAPPHC